VCIADDITPFRRAEPSFSWNSSTSTFSDWSVIQETPTNVTVVDEQLEQLVYMCLPYCCLCFLLNSLSFAIVVISLFDIIKLIHIIAYCINSWMIKLVHSIWQS